MDPTGLGSMTDTFVDFVFLDSLAYALMYLYEKPRLVFGQYRFASVAAVSSAIISWLGTCPPLILPAIR